MDYMNKHFHVTMPLTYCTLTARSTLYKITNPVNYLSSVDNVIEQYLLASFCALALLIIFASDF